MKRSDVQAAYLSWFRSVDDPELKIEIAQLAAGAFDDDEEEPSDEVLDLLVEKENWDELTRLGYESLCPDDHDEVDDDE